MQAVLTTLFHCLTSASLVPAVFQILLLLVCKLEKINSLPTATSLSSSISFWSVHKKTANWEFSVSTNASDTLQSCLIRVCTQFEKWNSRSFSWSCQEIFPRSLILDKYIYIFTQTIFAFSSPTVTPFHHHLGPFMTDRCTAHLTIFLRSFLFIHSIHWSGKKCALLTAVKTSLNIRHIQHGWHIIFPDHQYNSDFSLTSWSSPTFSNFPGQGWKWGSKTKTTCQTSVVLLGSTVAEERAVLGVGKIVITMADSRTNGTDTDAVDHLTGVTVIPVLVHELLLRYCVCTQLVIQRLVVLQYSTSNMSAHTTSFGLYLTGPFFQRLLQVRLAFQ